MNGSLKTSSMDTVYRTEEERLACQKIAESHSSLITGDINEMSKEELAFIVHGFVCKVLLIESAWIVRKSQYSKETFENSKCPSISKIFAALYDYERLSQQADSLAACDAAEKIAFKNGNWWFKIVRVCRRIM